MDRINILLLDDQPFSGDQHGVATLGVPEATDEYLSVLQRFFNLLWLRTPTEMREYYYLLRAIGGRDPRVLGAEAVIPEVIVFDFALTSRSTAMHTLDDRGKSFPNVAMRRRLLELGGDESDFLASPFPRPESIGYHSGDDRFGCYAGGLICLELSEYCSVGIPTTQYISKGETFFFEWFLEKPLRGLFDKKTRSAPTWPQILSVGLPELRERISERVRAGTLRLGLASLLRWAHNDSRELVAEDECIELYSRFGSRRLPLRGLFADLFFPSFSSREFPPASFSVVAEWASGCLKGLLAATRLGRVPISVGEFEDARVVAERYWDAYLSVRCADRYLLSELVAMDIRSKDQDDEIRNLCIDLGVDELKAKNEPERVRLARGPWSLGHWKGACSSEISARWAVLLLAVRADQYHRIATEAGLRFFDTLTTEDREVGEVYHEHLTDSLGKEAVRELFAHIELQEYQDGSGAGIVGIPIRRAAEVDDILMALDPLPTDLLTYLHKKRDDGGGRIKDSTYLTNALKRLGSTAKQMGLGSDNSWGSLALSISDVLAVRDYRCEWCDAVFRDKKNITSSHPKENCAHGLRVGEGVLLRAYADELGFKEVHWPAWLKNAP